ncbi:MAG: extracellular solute-binding protein [Firmicutes bacterium]|nr:extracellular solute-binding protein [Bacillota bacterium]
MTRKGIFVWLFVVLIIGLMSSSAALAGKVSIRITAIPGPTAKAIEANAQLFMKKNPDINVVVDIAGGAEEVYKPNFPVIAASPDRPDMAWYWVDGRQYQDMVKAGLLEPLDDLYAKEGWFKSLPESTIKKYTSPDGHLYAVNQDIVWYPQVYYNKKIFKNLGIQSPATPYMAYASLNEWYAVINKIRGAGYQPVSYGGKEGWIIGHTHDALLQRMIPQDLLNDLYENWRSGSKPKVRYTDEVWTQVDRMLLEWAKKGVFADGFMGRSYPEGRMLFVQGKAAMYQDGSWAVGILRNEAPNLDFGWMLYPKIKKEIDPKFLLYAGNGIMILKGTKHLDACKRFLAFILSKEGQENMMKNAQLIPSRMDVDPNVIKKMADPLVYEMWLKLRSIGTSTGWDDPVPAEPAERSFILFQELLTGTRTPESVGKELEDIVEKLRTKK